MKLRKSQKNTIRALRYKLRKQAKKGSVEAQQKLLALPGLR